MTDTIDNYYAQVAGEEPSSPSSGFIDSALQDARWAGNNLLAPFAQGASYGLAGNLGMLPSDYAAMRQKHSFIFPALETAGEIGTGAMAVPLMPELGLGRLGTFLARAGYNALAGGALGAASTNVSGGSVTSNAEGGAIGGAILAPLASIASALSPRVAPKVASYLDKYSSLFGDSAKTVAQMEKEVSSMTSDIVSDIGPLSLKTKLPPSPMFPAPQFQQNLSQRLTALARKDYSGAGNAGKQITDTINSISDIAANNNGTIPPDAFIRLTQRGGDVEALTRSNNVEVQKAGNEIRSALFDGYKVLSPSDADSLDAADKAHQLWRIADGYAAGGELSKRRLTALVQKHYNMTGDLAIAPGEMAKGAVEPSWMAKIESGVGPGIGAGIGLGLYDLAGEHLAPMIGHMSDTLGTPGLLATGVAGLLAGAGATALRRTPLALRTGIARALGKPNPLLVSQPSSAITASALAGADMAPEDASSKSSDPVLNYYQNLR